MKIVQNKFIPFKGYKYINLFGIIFTRDKSKITDVEYNHEKIHLKQMQEMLYFLQEIFDSQSQELVLMIIQTQLIDLYVSNGRQMEKIIKAILMLILARR